MPKALRFKLFRAGRYPAGWSAAATEAGVLLAQEGIPVVSTSTALQLPGRNRNNGVRKLVGSLVIRPDHLRIGLGPLVLADLQLDRGRASDPHSPSDHAAVAYLEPAGVRIHVEVARLVSPGTGTAEIVYDAPLGPDVLGRIAGTTWVLPLTPVLAQRLSVRL